MVREPRPDHQFHRPDQIGDICWTGSYDDNPDSPTEIKKKLNKEESLRQQAGGQK
jgi:hypothetical protein